MIFALFEFSQESVSLTKPRCLLVYLVQESIYFFCHRIALRGECRYLEYWNLGTYGY